MPKRVTILRLLPSILVMLSIGAMSLAEPGVPRPRHIQSHDTMVGHSAGPTKSGGDTIFVYGGPGTLQGKFENAEGLKDWQDWTTNDRTATPGYWNISSYNAADLDPTQPGNHAWWCGRQYASCREGDPTGGYGHNWNTSLSWIQAIADPSRPATVHIQARLSCDLETTLDLLHLDHLTAAGWVESFHTYTGQEGPRLVQHTFTYDPDDYAGLEGCQIGLRWRVVSDAIWDDEDCLWPTDGAARLDLIQVTVDQGDGDPQVSLETCEPGDPVSWTADPIGVGDFAAIRTHSAEEDVCVSNYSPLATFIDDGLVVPGTGGSQCLTWCYGPGGHVVNTSGGLLGGDNHLDNEIRSPLISWPVGGLDGGILAFDTYLHEELITGTSPGVFMYWSVRSTSSTNPADLESASWRDAPAVYYGGPSWSRSEFDFSTLLVSGPRWIQVAIGAWEGGYNWGYDGDDATPAPYIDNICVKAFTRGGPGLSVEEQDLANDGFPESGFLDRQALGANSVRFDRAAGGDSVVVRCAAVREGSTLTGPPAMHWRLDANPLFDAYRTTGLGPTGVVAGVEVSAGAPGDDSLFAFDLPDSAFLFPGDVLRYYFEASDNLGGLARVPADTVGFSEPLDGLGGYPDWFTVRALPSMSGTIPSEQPPVLLWYDAEAMEPENEWATALDNLGFRPGIDYDIFFTNAASSGLSNGLGASATLDQIDQYDTILYTSGRGAAATICGSDHGLGCGGDEQLLVDWLESASRNLLVTGNALLFDLYQNGRDLFERLGVHFLDRDVRFFIANQSNPLLVARVDNPVLDGSRRWLAYGGCFESYSEFTAIQATVDAVSLAEFTDPNGDPGAYDVSGAVLHELDSSGSRCISLPYGFSFIHDPVDDVTEGSVRTSILGDVLGFFGHAPGESPVRIPDLAACQVSHSILDTVSIYSAPDFGGLPLASALDWDGVVGSTPRFADASVTVTLVDDEGEPVVGYPAQDIWLDSNQGGLALAPRRAFADAATDHLGRATISGLVRCGGATDIVIGETLQVVIGGVPLPGGTIPVQVNSFDLTGDLWVNSNDQEEFSYELGTSETFRADFWRDGKIDLLDAILMTRAIGSEVEKCTIGQEEAGDE